MTDIFNSHNFVVSTTFMPDGADLSEALDVCTSMGVRTIELGSNHCYRPDFLELVKSYDFRYLTHNYFPIPSESFVLNVASFDDKIRERSLKHVKSAIDFTKNCGGELYTFHPGFLTDPDGSNLDSSNYDFTFMDSNLKSRSRETGLGLLWTALEEIASYADSQGVRLAIETEGSLNKPHHLLMQEPDEYREFLYRFGSSSIGINLNIGHVFLASKHFSFDVSEFVELIFDKIYGLELSHNHGQNDDHLPLEKEGWYWDIILDARFAHIPKILEFRNVTKENFLDTIQLVEFMVKHASV